MARGLVACFCEGRARVAARSRGSARTQQSPKAQRSNSLPRGPPLPPSTPCSWSSHSLIDNEADRDEAFLLTAGPLGCLHTNCGSIKAQLEELPCFPVSWHKRPSHSLHQSIRLRNRTLSEAYLYVQLLHSVHSSLGTSQTPTQGSRTFIKVGIKHPVCPSVCAAGEGGGLSGIHLQRSWGTSCSRAQGLSEKAAAVRGPTSCPASASTSLGTLSSLLLQGTLFF